jgi:hypothetical protein
MKCNCGYDENDYLSKLNHGDKFLKSLVGVICRDDNKQIIGNFNGVYICPACGTMKVDIKERR